MKKTYEKPKITVADIDTESLLVTASISDMGWDAKQTEYQEFDDEQPK